MGLSRLPLCCHHIRILSSLPLSLFKMMHTLIIFESCVNSSFHLPSPFIVFFRSFIFITVDSSGTFIYDSCSPTSIRRDPMFLWPGMAQLPPRVIRRTTSRHTVTSGSINGCNFSTCALYVFALLHQYFLKLGANVVCLFRCYPLPQETHELLRFLLILG